MTPTSRKATFTPSSALAASTTYTVNVSGAKDLADNTMSPVSWTFTTAAASSALPVHDLAEQCDSSSGRRPGQRSVWRSE